jgi:hypothetical protein
MRSSSLTNTAPSLWNLDLPFHPSHTLLETRPPLNPTSLYHGYFARTEATTPHVIGCLECEMGRWEGGFMPRIKGAWLVVKLAAKPELLKSPRIWREPGVPNEDNPQVRKALEGIPEVKPARLLSVGRWRYERDPRNDRRRSAAEGEGLVDRLGQDIISPNRASSLDADTQGGGHDKVILLSRCICSELRCKFRYYCRLDNPFDRSSRAVWSIHQHNRSLEMSKGHR